MTGTIHKTRDKIQRPMHTAWSETHSKHWGLIRCFDSADTVQAISLSSEAQDIYRHLPGLCCETGRPIPAFLWSSNTTKLWLPAALVCL